MVGLIKLLHKLELPESLIAPARSALEAFVVDGVDDYQLVYGVVGLLAKEGSAASAKTLDRFAGRAEATDRLRGDTVSTRCLLTVLDAVGQGAAVARVASAARQFLDGDRSTNSALTFIKRIVPGFAAAKKYHLQVRLGPAGTGVPLTSFGTYQHGARIHLEVDPTRKPYWAVELRSAPAGPHGLDNQRYSNSGGEVLQDDLGLPSLQKIEDFPSWVSMVGKQLNVSFSVEDAWIDAGRYRSAIVPVREWLAKGDRMGLRLVR